MEEFSNATKADNNDAVKTAEQTAETAKLLDLRQEAEMRNKAWYFKRLALPCLIHALIFTVCIYHNFYGVAVPVWIASLCGLVVHFIKTSGRELKKDSYFVITVMMLLAISTFLTANGDIITMNYFAEFLLLIALILHNYANDDGWDFGKYIGEIVVACFGTLGRLFSPITDCTAFNKMRGERKNSRIRLVLIGIVIAVPCLVILGLLLASADLVFERLLGDFFKNIVIPENFFGVLFTLLFGFFAAYCGMRYIEAKAPDIVLADRRHGEPVIAVTITSLIAVLYLVFSAVQIIYLFIGNFKLPEGITYAEYARTGFFQLLAVCVMNLLLVLIMKKYIKFSKVLNIVLLVISACTYIMIASSAIRMIMYIRAYHLTFMRVFVLVALFTLAVLLSGVIILIFNEKFGFFRFGVAVISVIYIALAFSHADYFIAKYNLSFDTEYEIYTSKDKYNWDICYMSLDAAPAFKDYLEKAGVPEDEWRGISMIDTYIRYNSDIIDESIGIRKYNYSCARAKQIFGNLPEPADWKKPIKAYDVD